MKGLFAFLFFSMIGFSAFADEITFAEENPCNKWITCGTFEGAGRPEVQSIFEDLGHNNVNWKVLNPGGKWTSQVLSFHDDGTFVLDHERGVGACTDKVCRFSSRPLEYNGEIFIQVFTLRFKEDGIKLEKTLVYDEGKTTFVSGEYVKTKK